MTIAMVGLAATGIYKAAVPLKIGGIYLRHTIKVFISIVG
jgi:hypothetical protein